MLRAVQFCYFVGFLTCIAAHVTFTNLKCIYKNKTFGDFEYCYIKPVNRTHKYISIYEKLYFKPLDNITANFQLKRYDHGYKPFFINLNIDVCQFLRNRRNLFTNIIFKTFEHTSNINHSCPFNHDIIIDKLWTGNIDADLIKYVPIPNGEYALFTTFYAYKIEICSLDVYMKMDN